MARETVELETLTEVLDDLDRRGITGVQRYRAVNGFISLKARYNDIPVSGVFELTPLCNLNCKMCYVHLNANQIPEDERLLSVQEWKKIMRQAVDAGMMYATLTGGECMTYPGFRELYLYLVSMGIQPDILTNGRLLTEDMVAFLAKYPPGAMQVSVYGSDEDAYEQVTGHRAFHEVMQGIERAKSAGLNITLAITPNRYMQKNVQELLDLVRAQGIPYAIGDAMLEARKETGRKLSDYVIEVERCMQIQRAEREYQMNLLAPQVGPSVPRYIPVTNHSLRGLLCGGGHSAFHVNWKGKLCPCTGFSAAVQCDILEWGFDRAWDDLRQTMLQFVLPAECENCSMKSMCATCPAEKCGGVLNGKLKTEVCSRMKYLANSDLKDGLHNCLIDNAK